jgi:hypothetical protein
MCNTLSKYVVRKQSFVTLVHSIPNIIKATFNYLTFSTSAGYLSFPGNVVAQLFEAPRYKPEGCEFDSRWCHWNFSTGRTIDWLRHWYKTCYQRKRCGRAFPIHVDKTNLRVSLPPQYSIILEKLIFAQQVKKYPFLEWTTDSALYILKVFILWRLNFPYF